MAARKPPGLDRFTEALAAVASVPKEEVEAKIATTHKGREGRRIKERLKKQRKKK